MLDMLSRQKHALLPDEAQREIQSLLDTYATLTVGGATHPGCDAEIARITKKSPDDWWWTDLAQVQLCVVAAYDDDTVRSSLLSWRRRMHEVIGDGRYATYLQAAPDPNSTTTTAGMRRSDLCECIQTVHYFYAAYGVAARSRSLVTEATLRVALAMLVLEGLAAILLGIYQHIAKFPPLSGGVFGTLELMLATSAAAILGSVVSVQRRLQDPSVDADPFFRYITTTADRISISFISPLFGAIFGLVVYGLLAAQLISGTFIPTFSGPNYLPAAGKDIALLLLFGFIAGFAEQFVPDALNRIAARALSGVFGAADVPPPPPAPIIVAKQLVVPTVDATHAGDGATGAQKAG
jgi:hypothetical protein